MGIFENHHHAHHHKEKHASHTKRHVVHLPEIQRRAAHTEGRKKYKGLATAEDWAAVRAIEPLTLRTQRLRPPSESQAAARQLRVAFGAWSHDSTMSGAAFSRLCKRAGLCSRGFVLTDIDATFAAAAGYARKLTLAGFERAVTAIAVKREQSIDAIAEIIYAAGAPSKATAVAPVVDRPIVAKLADPACFTGTHKHRFDADGNGRGLDGRDSIPKGKGHLPAGATLQLRRYANPLGSKPDFTH